MERIINPGTGRYGAVFCKIEYRDGRLSITGVVGPKRNGDAVSCGQIVGRLAEDVTTYAAGWSRPLLERFALTWEQWHLNDMRAGCEHQRAEWDTLAKLALRPLTWSPEFHRRLRLAKSGEMPAEEYATWQETVRTVHALTIAYPSPKHPDAWGEAGARMLAAGLVVEEAKEAETKGAGWVYPSEHPGGLLLKPCATCGYKYGSAWLREEVPADVLAFLASLPETTVTPEWV